MTHYGRSRRGDEAIECGRGPASMTAARIGHGCPAAWIAENVNSTEWHHCNTGRRADGMPVNFYEFQACWSAWFAANWHAGRAGNAVAARRARAMRAGRPRDDVRGCEVADALRGPVKPLPTGGAPAGEHVGAARLTRRAYERTRGRYVPYETTCEIEGAEYRGEWLVWQGGRCKRDSVIGLVVVNEKGGAA